MRSQTEVKLLKLSEESYALYKLSGSLAFFPKGFLNTKKGSTLITL